MGTFAALALPQQVSDNGWKAMGRRVIALGTATSGIIVLILFVAGGAYLNGVLFSTFARSGGTSAVFVGVILSDRVIISQSWTMIGGTVAGCVVALALTAMSRNWKNFVYALLFLSAGCLVTIGNLRLHTNESMYKHDDLAAHCPKVSGPVGCGVRFSEGWSRSGGMLIAAA
jgi:hypothetical protein